MCGISGFYSKKPIENGMKILKRFNEIQRHRGPDGEGFWTSNDSRVGLSHVRLSILDLNERSKQPMKLSSGKVVTFNGEIYNYIELREELKKLNFTFNTSSDTEVLLSSFEAWGNDCLNKFRGMFSFAIYDPKTEELFAARDNIGIKPFYFINKNGFFAFASEIKTLLPLLPKVELDLTGLQQYLSLQFYLNDKTLFHDIHTLQPGHFLKISKNSNLEIKKYWDVDYSKTELINDLDAQRKLAKLFDESVKLHARSDVEVGAYLSGGLDSSAVSSALSQGNEIPTKCFIGRFKETGFDEFEYAESLKEKANIEIHSTFIQPTDFIDNFEKIVYHLDMPIAGPGAFPQYLVSRDAAKMVKVILGGQGADEIFGGYTRYLIAYFEQCIKGAIDGTLNNGNFVVSYESIIPNLNSLKNYTPLIKDFFADGLFDSRDKRYFRLINRANSIQNIIDWDIFPKSNIFEEFSNLYWSNVGRNAYFDNMTHFDTKTLLPALLHVEDRVSMAHGIESRVPFVDKEIIEFAALTPASIKFKNGELKRLPKLALSPLLPSKIVDRKDKMGFPVPLNDWIKSNNNVREYVFDLLGSQSSKNRIYWKEKIDINKLTNNEPSFSRGLWGFLNLEVCQKLFIDSHVCEFKDLW